MYNKGLFCDWVPKPVQLLLILIFLLIILPVSGIYIGNISDMTGSLGSLAEEISMASNAGTIGMAVVFPLLLRTKAYFRSKELITGSLLLMAMFNMVCGTTDNTSLLLISSFLIGFLKMFAMIEVLLPVMFMLSPNGDRGRFYSIFYPLSIALGQLLGYWTTVLAASLRWQQAYLFIAMLLLGAAMLALVFMHNLRSAKKVPMYYFDWLSLVLLSVALLSLNYGLVYGRQQQWFESVKLQGFSAIFVLSLAIFIKRQMLLKRPYLPLGVFIKKNVYNAVLMIFLMGMFVASGSVQSVFTSGVLGYDAVTNASLNLLIIPGIILGAITAFIWFKKKWWLKPLVLLGFGAYQVYAVYMYFLIAPVVEIEMFIFPSVLKGFGMCVLFIAIGFYMADTLPMSQMLSASTVMIVTRSFIGPAFFGAVFAWAQYKVQWQQATQLAGQMEGLSTQTSNALITYGAVQVQAILNTVKEIYGYVIMAGWVILLYITLHRFRPLHRRKLILMRKKWRYGESVEGYQLSGKPVASTV